MKLYSEFKKVAQQYKKEVCIVDTINSSIQNLPIKSPEEKEFSYEQIMEKIKKLSLLFNTNEDKELIAICINKTNEFVVAQLAINKAGKCFLPLDTNQNYRNSDILKIAKPRYIILKNDKYYNDYAQEQDYELVKNYTKEINIWESKNFKIYPDNCDYLIFSSGSTGTPKGIMLSEDPVLEVVKQQAYSFKIDDKTKFAWFLSPAFDASLSDIYTTLLKGGALHIPNFSMDKLKTLIIYIERNKITHSDLSPSILPTLNKMILPKTLKVIVFGGELASESVIKEIVSNYNIQLFNAYGPTETTICSSFSKVNDKWSSTNIGKPLDGVLYKIEDNELHIGGNHLAIGYLNEELNSKFYIENGIRWYKTGDNVKEQDGEYFYIGRKDNQFKYHGQLICPEEVENAAYQSGAEMSVCIYDEYKRKIHLYYVGNIDKESLKKRIASYMTPHYFHQEEKLPLNSNGKLDVKILKERINNHD